MKTSNLFRHLFYLPFGIVLLSCSSTQNMQPGRLIEGYVTDVNGFPVRNICIESPQVIQHIGHTDYNGKYSLWVQDKDEVQLTFHSRYNKLPDYDGALEIDDYEAQEILVRRSDTLVNIMIKKTADRERWDWLIDDELSRARYIEGHVNCESGEALRPLIWVEGLPFVPRETPFFTYGDEEGYYRIAIPSRDEVRVVFRQAGYADENLILKENFSDKIDVQLKIKASDI